MPAYIVRIRETKELVSFLVCSRRDLAHAVDETTDPSECEFVEVVQGGIHWPKPYTPAISGSGDFVEINLSGAEFLDGMLDAVLDESASWRPVGPIRQYARMGRK